MLPPSRIGIVYFECLNTIPSMQSVRMQEIYIIKPRQNNKQCKIQPNRRNENWFKNFFWGCAFGLICSMLNQYWTLSLCPHDVWPITPCTCGRHFVVVPTMMPIHKKYTNTVYLSIFLLVCLLSTKLFMEQVAGHGRAESMMFEMHKAHAAHQTTRKARADTKKAQIQ